MAIPVAIILVCTMPAFIRNAEEILKVLAIMMIFLASIATIGIWSVIANEYSYPDNDRDREFIKGAVLVTGVASAAMIIGATMADRSHVPTGLAAGFIPAGFIITVSGAVTAALEGNNPTREKGRLSHQTGPTRGHSRDPHLLGRNTHPLPQPIPTLNNPKIHLQDRK